MPIRSILSVSLILRYIRGSLTYSNLRATATDALLYELGSAINSLQREPVDSINKLVSARIARV